MRAVQSRQVAGAIPGLVGIARQPMLHEFRAIFGVVVYVTVRDLSATQPQLTLIGKRAVIHHDSRAVLEGCSKGHNREPAVMGGKGNIFTGGNGDGRFGGTIEIEYARIRSSFRPILRDTYRQ